MIRRFLAALRQKPLPWILVAGLAVLLLVATAALGGGGLSQQPPVAVSSPARAPTSAPAPAPTDTAPATRTAPATPSDPETSAPAPSPGTTPSGKSKTKSSSGNDPMSQAAIDARPGQGPLPSDQEVPCPSATTTVSTGPELTAALGSAKAGDVIAMRDGTYSGNFSTENSGTATSRIFLCGGPGAVLDAGSDDNGYVFHLNGASNWVLSGFTAQNGQKGIVADSSDGSVIEHLTVTNVGDEGIHLRNNSSGNLVIGNTVSHTGSKSAKFGEGIYVGTAVSNWCTYSDCRADASNYNIIAGNDISNTTSESVDIKEGTVGGIIKNNHFDGAGMTAAKSWINVKGNAWTIDANEGHHSPQDGYQSHNILDQWGDHNLFTRNTGSVDGSGYAFALRPEMNNTVSCSNTVSGAGRGLSNIPCVNI
jgi:parallel beta-helix repeat protein